MNRQPPSEIKSFACILDSLNLLLQKHNLTNLEKDEKIIFDYIISSIARQKPTNINEIIEKPYLTSKYISSS